MHHQYLSHAHHSGQKKKTISRDAGSEYQRRGSLFLVTAGHFSWNRPGETLTRPDPRLPTKRLTRPDPSPPHPTPNPHPTPPHMYYMFHGFNIQVANRNDIQYLQDFEGNSENYFSSGLVMFPEGEKTISSGLICQDRGLEAAKRLQISDASNVHSSRPA